MRSGLLSSYSTFDSTRFRERSISCTSLKRNSRFGIHSVLLEPCFLRHRPGLPVFARHVEQYKDKEQRDESKAISENEANRKDKQTSPISKVETDNDGFFKKFKSIVNTFWVGCKQLLWVDARKAWATKNKLKRHDYDLTILTREELSHMRQTQKDIIKSLPVALLFFVPFVGYFAPVLGYLFPKRLLSPQFWDIEQQKKFAFEDHTKRSQYYCPLIQEVGWSSRELKNQDLLHLCIKVIDGYHLVNEEILKQRGAFKVELLSIAKMPRFHLVKLCKTWLLPVKWYVPSRVLREFLSYRIKQIIEDDAAIRRDGMDILSEICIRQACHARGLDKYSFDISVMKEWLEDWIKLTENLSEEDSSFIAHCAAIKTMNFSKIMQKKEPPNDDSINISEKII